MSKSKPVVFWMTEEQLRELETKIIKDLQAELAAKDARIAELENVVDLLEQRRIALEGEIECVRSKP